MYNTVVVSKQTDGYMIMSISFSYIILYYIILRKSMDLEQHSAGGTPDITPTSSIIALWVLPVSQDFGPFA